MITLQRTIEVQTFDTEGTVALGKDRPEWLAVARLAADLDRPIIGGDVTRELLGKVPEHVGWLVIDRCVHLGLLHRDGARGPATLTESGRIALERGLVLEPQEGTWRFFYVDDPLIHDSLLHVAPMPTENAQHERKELHANKWSGKRPGRGDSPPSEIEDAAGNEHVFASIANGDSFEVRDIAQRGERGPKGHLDLRLSWSPDTEPTVTLQGQLELSRSTGKKRGRNDDQNQPRRARVDRVLPLPQVLTTMDYNDQWAALVGIGSGLDEHELRVWQDETGDLLLPVEFKGLAIDARRKFSMKLNVPRPELTGLGCFDDTVIADIALVPRTPKDATEWAAWLQWGDIRDHVLPSHVADISAHVQERFSHHDVVLPELHELLERAQNNPGDRHARFLLAPYDLGLWGHGGEG